MALPSSGFYTDYSYDAAFRLSAIRTRTSGSINRFWQTITYDQAGNITSILDKAFVPGVQEQVFSYDSLNRLTAACTLNGATYSTGTSNGQYNETYQYDALGNLVEKAGVTMGYGQAIGIAAAAKPHAVTHLNNAQKFWYDANGNMTRRIDDQDQDWTLTWTAENMLDRATSNTGKNVNLTYDANGMMVTREEQGQKTVYLGKLYQHNTTLNAVTKQYLFNGQLAALRDGQGVSYLIGDHLGSTTTTLWANGTVRADRRDDPWGQERWSQYTTPTGYRYTGQRWDSSLGLYDYNARYFDPFIARFISADTLVPNLASPQAFNRFAYTLGNPLGKIDPSGHQDISINSTGIGGPGLAQAMVIITILSAIITASAVDATIETVQNGRHIESVEKTNIPPFCESFPLDEDVAPFFSPFPGQVLGPHPLEGFDFPKLKIPLILERPTLEETELTILLSEGGKEFTGGTSHSTLPRRNIRGLDVRVDVEYPTGKSTGNVHVQVNGEKIYIDSVDDLGKLPSRLRKNTEIRRAVEKAIGLLDRF